RHDVGTSWGYEPLPVLESLAARQLWVVAGDDLEAPNGETLRRLRALQDRHRPLDLAVFRGTDRGILEFDASGADRVMLRDPDGYFRLIVDWFANQELRGAYGSALLEPATRGQPADTPAPPVGTAPAH